MMELISLFLMVFEDIKYEHTAIKIVGTIAKHKKLYISFVLIFIC